MNTPLTPEQRAQRWGTVAKWAAFAILGFLFAPFAMATITGMLGLIVAGSIAATTWFMVPVVEHAAINMRLKMIKAEAARNPVETLEHDYTLKSQALEDRKKNLERLNGGIRTFADRVDAMRSKYGAQDNAYLKMSEQLGELKRVALFRAEKWKEAYAQLKRYADEIDRAKMIWDAGLAAAAANEASGLSEEEVYQQLRAQTAFDAIETGYNTALASLDTSMLEAPAEKALPAPTQRVEINITPTKAKATT